MLSDRMKIVATIQYIAFITSENVVHKTYAYFVQGISIDPALNTPRRIKIVHIKVCWKSYHITVMLYLYLCWSWQGAGGLREVDLQVPPAVLNGTSATLLCSYDLEGDPLYTVKWYKGREEFFRYVPKEHPHTRVFALPGVFVDVSKCVLQQT